MAYVVATELPEGTVYLSSVENAGSVYWDDAPEKATHYQEWWKAVETVEKISTSNYLSVRYIRGTA